MNRGEHLRRLREEPFDVLVIGGGITGAAAARDAARRGLRTALVEARDFGQGTSSRSSRLVHGGLRYLEHLEFDLVFEASRERRILLHIAPHMVRPLEFLFPIYEEGRVGKRKLDAGMWLYDALSFFRNIERHQMLDVEGVAEREPTLEREGLLGGARYYDAQVDDARLVLSTVLGAAESGAAVANRVEAVEVVTGEEAATGARVRDDESGEEWTVSARLVVNATGPWTEETVRRGGREWGRRLRPTRGTHIQIPRERLGHERGLIFESPLDQRIMFVLPWRDLTLVGTTDEDDASDPARVTPTARDVAYLLESTDRLFPGAGVGPGDVIAAWAGLRPLVGGQAREGAGDDEEVVSRDFVVTEDVPGMLTIAGGKLTSHRRMAEKVIDRAGALLLRRFGREVERECDTDRVPLPGGDLEDLDRFRERLAERAASHRLPGPSVERLARAYGTRADEVLELMGERDALREPVIDVRPYLAAEVVQAVRREMAIHVEDVVFRRTHLGWETRRGFREGCRRVAEIMGDELGWSDARREEEVARAAGVRRRDEAWREELEARWGAREEPDGRRTAAGE